MLPKQDYLKHNNSPLVCLGLAGLNEIELHKSTPIQCPMPHFAVFFSDNAGFGIEMVQALDAGHAQDIARAQHPTGRLSALPAELLDGQDRHKLLRAWLRGEG